MLNFALGPVMSSDLVLKVGSEQTPYFRTPEFSKITLENEKLMKEMLFADEDSKVIFLTGSGTSGMEATVMNVFTENDKVEQDVLSQLSFGGGCINDTIIHLATPYLGFGGVGNSGMGSYHGKKSFDTFTHEKSIIKKSDKIDIPVRYMPYNKAKEQLMKFFLKL